MSNSAVRLFVSYSHDSTKHMDRVLALADRLRADGVDADIDQYETAPARGWPRWMEDRIEWAERILVVVTETYARRFRGLEEKGRGRGVTWEGAILTQELYDARGDNSSIIPIVFDGRDADHVPIILRSATFYNLSQDGGYDKLYRRLTDQPEIAKGPLGKLREMPLRPRRTTFVPEQSTATQTPSNDLDSLEPRHQSTEPPEWPERPYPVLEPYTHPELLTGRDADLARCRAELAGGLVLCLHARSGTGKSSFLLAGLVPALRADGYPVAVVRRPDEPGIALRLLTDLAELPSGFTLDDRDFTRFADHLAALRLRSEKPPILVLDQFEDAFRRDEERGPLACIGPLLAATAACKLPQEMGHVCRWILACRQDAHGAVEEWLANLLREARSLGVPGIEALPMDLKRQEYARELPLPPFGEAAPGADPRTTCLEAFRCAIEEPLERRTEDGSLRYRYRFAAGEAERLAAAFAAERERRPRAPLTPELQVVLDRLLREASAGEDGIAEVTVGDDPESLIRDALGEHLRRKLIEAFRGADPKLAKERRTQALLALRELADAQGQRQAGVDEESLSRRIGGEAGLILDRLAAPEIRLLLVEEDELRGERLYSLPHDSLAAVINDLFADPRSRALYDLDEELFDLRKTVALRVELFEREGATDLPPGMFEKVAAGRDRLPREARVDQWWQACVVRRREEQERKQRERSRRGLLVAAVILLVVGGVAAGWWLVEREQERGDYLARLQNPEPEVVLQALIEERPPVTSDEVAQAIDRRGEATDVLDTALELAPHWRAASVAPIAEGLASRYTEIDRPGLLDEDLWDRPLDLELRTLLLLLWSSEHWADENERERLSAAARDLGTGLDSEQQHRLFSREARSILGAVLEAAVFRNDGEPIRSLVAARGEQLQLDAAGMTVFAETLWALDYVAALETRIGNEDSASNSRQLRDELLAPLRAARPPPEEEELARWKWVPVDAGSFSMGSEHGETPVHEVMVSAFRLLAHEVTVEQYALFEDAGEQAEARLPVYRVTWHKAYVFAAWLGGRLPTEAEWEYAARADCEGSDYCSPTGVVTVDDMAWHRGNSGGSLHVVMDEEGGIAPNAWGLYDMYGNVWEWVADWYGVYSEKDQVDPWGPASGEDRVIRGGSFYDSAEFARSAYRYGRNPRNVNLNRGFRVLLPAPSVGNGS